MMTYGWQGNRSVEEWLLAEPYRFDFFQAVRLLELLNPKAASPGAGSEPEKEAVRFHSRVGMDFPASEVQKITRSAEPGVPADMTVNFLGLAGAFGPLSTPDTELLLESIRGRDYAMRDFLDIFNHRLVSLMYQVRKLHRVELTTRSPEETPVAGYIFSFFGLGLKQLRNRMQVPDRALLHSAGILAQHPRSAAGLERLLSSHFQVAAGVRQLVGRWRPLEPDQWSRVGVFGQNRRLGDNVVLGTRIWDQQGAFHVQLGPMKLPQFLDYLPNGTAYTALCELTRFYAGPDFEFEFGFTVDATSVPETRLGQARLGWTSWLKTQPLTSDDSQVRLRPS